ncbi:fungal Zn binuclear cluster domain containing protein [Paecilomyces variotii No. 5]|uniref:Fungal Zn binuclear cluster domain containing protein n=1 Tax=Byssochlamys spectabilis (strain No. 5 / NBRC 109023) TaxID=1356009 RepID=V5FW27_BYSSN|nr:fungal Zn binuclear cluster domain containing protein [Paecilomyces variotii No. 5]
MPEVTVMHRGLAQDNTIMSARPRKRQRRTSGIGPTITSTASTNTQSPSQAREYRQVPAALNDQSNSASRNTIPEAYDSAPVLSVQHDVNSSQRVNPVQTPSINGLPADHNQSSSRHRITSEPWLTIRYPLSLPSQETLDLWSSWLFVKSRLITAQEAVTYVDLFFENMNPLSPVLHDYYRDHAKHPELINREPVLCCTIIALSARYHLLAGDGGVIRGFYIHDRMWTYCQTLFHRLVWNKRRVVKDQDTHLGTIESYLLVADWHPRSVHLPVEIEFWQPELAIPDDEQMLCYSKVPNKWLREVEETAQRSDRMSWMLLGNALTLGHELDLFSGHEDPFPDPSDSDTGLSFATYLRLRRSRLGKLLFVYISQLASRIGCTLPRTPFHDSIMSSLRTPKSTLDREWHNHMTSWIELSRLIRTSSEFLFPSKTVTQELLRSGRYAGFLGHFRPLLSQWLDNFKNHANESSFCRIMLIDYHFVRVYINSLALQAVADRMSQQGMHTKSSPFEGDQDPDFVREVIGGSRDLLEIVIGLSRDGNLRYIPVRIFIRIASASMYLINALALGVRKDELERSLSLLDRTIEALCANATDDVHLGFRYAVLLREHTKGLRQRFVRIDTPPADFSFTFNDADAFLRNIPGNQSESEDNNGTQPIPQEGVMGQSPPLLQTSTLGPGQDLSGDPFGPGQLSGAQDYAQDEWFALPFASSGEDVGRAFMPYFFDIDACDDRFFWDIA